MVHKDFRRGRDGQGEAGRGRNPEHVSGRSEAPNGLQGSHPRPMAIVECSHTTRRRSPFYRPHMLDAAKIGLNKVLDRLNSSVRRDQAIRGDAQPGRRCGLAGRVNPTRREAAHVRQQLALPDTWISDHEHVDVPADAPPVGHHLRNATEELQGERLLFHVHPVHGGGDGRGDHPEDVGTRTHLADEPGVLFCDLDLLELDLFLFDRVDVHEDVEQRGLLTGSALLDASQDAVHDDPLSRRDAPREVVLQVEREPLGFLASAQAFGRLLDLELLRVDEERGLREEFELRRARGTLASALFLVTLERLAEGLSVLRLFDDRPASEALEPGVRDPRTDFGRLAHEAFDGNVLSEVLRPQRTDRDPSVTWKEFDPEMDLRALVPRGSEPADRLLSRHEDVQRVPEQVDRHVRVEPVQLIEGDEEAPVFGETVRDRDDLREVPHLLEELLPLRDQLVLWELYEHILSPTRRGGSLGNGHIPLRLPSTDARPMREFRSDRFHWNPNGSDRLTRRARSRTLGIARSRPRGRGSRRTRDTSPRAFDPRRQEDVRDPRTSRA